MWPPVIEGFMMDNNIYPKRKRIRALNYDYSQQGAYFVTICTHNRQHLFGEIVCDNIVGATLRGRPQRPDLMVEKWLGEIENKFSNVKIDEYIVMPDHVHVIIFITGDHIGSPLRDVIDWYKTMTTNEYIRNVRDGLYVPFEKAVWQRSYYDRIIRNEDELYEIRKYILENTLRWYYEQILICDG